MGRNDFTVLLYVEFLKILHLPDLPVGQVNSRIDLVTVFDAILTSRQTREKLQ